MHLSYQKNKLKLLAHFAKVLNDSFALQKASHYLKDKKIKWSTNLIKITKNATMPMPNFPTSTLSEVVGLMIKNAPLIYKRNEGYSTLDKQGCSMRYTELWNRDGFTTLHGLSGGDRSETPSSSSVSVDSAIPPPPPRKTLRTLVLLHGYGLGHGFYFQNFEHLLHGRAPTIPPPAAATTISGSSSTGSSSNNVATADPVYDRIVALDWPGFGHSEREVEFPNRAFYHDLFLSKDKSDKHTMTSVDFFVDSLHEWRVNDESSLKKIAVAAASPASSSGDDAKMPSSSGSSSDPLKYEYVIAGHSLGGYLVGNYALKYPETLSGLILISPIGLQAPPEMELAFFGNFLKLWTSFGFLGAFSLMFIRMLLSFNWTPQSIARTFVFLRMRDYVYTRVRGYVSNRFPNNTWSQEEIDVIAAYLFDIWTTGKTKGELSLNSLMVPKLSINKNYEVELANFNTMHPPAPVPAPAVSEETDPKSDNIRSSSSNSSSNVNGDASNSSTAESKETEKKVFQNGKAQSREQARRSAPPKPINIGMHTRMSLHDKIHEMPCPTLLLYGDNDWLCYKTVDTDVKKWQSVAKNPFHYEQIKDAGHYLYIDNSDMFNNSVISWTKKLIGDLK